MTNPNSLEIGRVGLFLLTAAGISLLSYRFIEFPQKSWRSLLIAKENESSKLALTS
jgi:hypothetical protein